MADEDDAQSQRESHYNQQRSSFRSDKSIGTSSRPGSAQLLQNFTLSDDDDENAREAPSPSPVIPMRRHTSHDSDKHRDSKSGRSRRGSARNVISREGRSSSRGQEYNIPDSYGNINEILGPSPIENPREQDVYQHATLEDERAQSQRSKRARRSNRSSLLPPTMTRRGTPASTLNVTALPQFPDDQTKGQTRLSALWNRNRASHDPSAQQGASRVATELYTISYLIFFSILGTLARLGLQWLTFYPGAPIEFSEVWANFAGTLVLGFLSEDSRLFRQEWGKGVKGVGNSNRDEQNDEERALQLTTSGAAAHAKVKKTIPLYIGLATGFCGSFTSFSSFMRDTFFALSNDMPTPANHPYPAGTSVSTSSTVHRNGGYSFMAVCAVLIITITLCYSALKVGAHLAIYLKPLVPTVPFFVLRRIIDPVMVLIAWLTWLGAVFMAIWPPDRPDGPSSRGPWTNETWRGQAIFACVFAPIGCLVRFYMSLKLNGVIAAFPLGTFCVNVFGTAVLGMAFDLQQVQIGSGLVGGGRVGCQVLQGIIDGFCGALTTVSTWIAELNALRRGHGWVYGATSTAVGLGLLVVIMGSVRWSVGWTVAACVT